MPDEDLTSRVAGDIGDAYDAILAESPAPDGDAPPAADTEFPATPLPDDISDDIPYRDAKKLRDDLARYKERYKPYEEHLGALDEQARQALLQDAPALAETLYALDPNDRQALLAFADVVKGGDPRQIAEVLDAWNQGFEQYRKPAQPEQPAVDLGEADLVTRADLERYMAEQEEQRAIAAAQDEILREVRELGYDPEATDPIERVRSTTLIQLASELDGDIARAHQLIEAAEQQRIDSYLAAKTKDASRTAAAPVGASPSTARAAEELSSDERSEAAMQMLDNLLGG